MSAGKIIIGLAVGLLFERPARKRSIDDIVGRLERSGDRITNRVRRASPGKMKVRKLRHAIGIERWGQRRLRVALGEPPTLDEYDGYQPPADADWNTLVAEWEATRRETIALARMLAKQSIADVRIRHNQLGPLSVGAWLLYLAQHAYDETIMIR